MLIAINACVGISAGNNNTQRLCHPWDRWELNYWVSFSVSQYGWSKSISLKSCTNQPIHPLIGTNRFHWWLSRKHIISQPLTAGVPPGSFLYSQPRGDEMSTEDPPVFEIRFWGPHFRGSNCLHYIPPFKGSNFIHLLEIVYILGIASTRFQWAMFRLRRQPYWVEMTLLVVDIFVGNYGSNGWSNNHQKRNGMTQWHPQTHTLDWKGFENWIPFMQNQIKPEKIVT